MLQGLDSNGLRKSSLPVSKYIHYIRYPSSGKPPWSAQNDPLPGPRILSKKRGPWIKVFHLRVKTKPDSLAMPSISRLLVHFFQLWTDYFEELVTNFWYWSCNLHRAGSPACRSLQQNRKSGSGIQRRLYFLHKWSAIPVTFLSWVFGNNFFAAFADHCGKIAKAAFSGKKRLSPQPLRFAFKVYLQST